MTVGQIVKKSIFIAILSLVLVVALYLIFIKQSQLEPEVLAQTQVGKHLYAENCAACHGETGKGGIGLPLNAKKLHTQLSDKYLTSTIKYGRPGRVMPGFADKLQEEQIKQIVSYLRSWTGESAPVYTEDKITGDYANGKDIYKLECAKCHGENLQGYAKGTGVTKSRVRELSVAAPALSSPGFLNSVPDMMLKKIIAEGRVESDMPAFFEKLDTKKQNDVVVYIRKRGTMLAAQWENNFGDKKPSIYKYYESPYGLEETKANMYNTIQAMNFRAYKPRLLEEDLLKKNESFELNKNQTVFRFCNFKMLNEFLQIEPRLGVFLPCNATVIKTDADKVIVVVPNLERIIPMFNNFQLNEKAKDVTNILDEMVEEALL